MTDLYPVQEHAHDICTCLSVRDGFRTPATFGLVIFFRIVDSFQLLIFVTNIIILAVERILYLSLLIVVMSSNIFRQKSSLVSQHTLILDLVTVVKMSFANVSQTENAKVLCDRGRELCVWITWQCLIGFFVMLFCSFVVLFGWTVLLSYLLELPWNFWKPELFDAILDNIVVARFFESSNVFLMFWQLDGEHFVITKKEADTERCFWKIGIAGILQWHKQSFKN